MSHAAGSGEFIIVLHGDDCSEPWRSMQEVVATLERQTGLTVLGGAAEAISPSQSLAEVFLAADEALSRAKDAALAA